ncbi:MAG: DEAD/DEAH box helicase [Deltaproteobacteria bacterium]|nr:DEAD/DEAH box helicase [Deltaproteobacteria bacterium]
MDFSELNLNSQIIKAVEKIGFVNPTPIQEEAIPAIIEGENDLVGLAQTGTGKTAAFGLPMMELIDFDQKHVQGLVICPTRELCLQITEDFKNYSKYIKGAKLVAVYGGASIEKQISQIRRGVQIIVATPGRLFDLMKRKVIKLNKVSYVVLDEADEMLNMGFKEDIDAILDKTPKDKRTWLFSATMPKLVAKIAENYMTDPVKISVSKKNAGADNIDHLNYVVIEKDRYAAVKRLIDFNPNVFGLVFCRTRMETQQIAEKLIKDGYEAAPLHGDLSQSQRDNVMKRFREKSIRLLVATDVAARGIDVDDITHVINYRLPDEVESYTHRSGRTGRAGKHGVSIALMNQRENRKLADIERASGVKFTRAKVPTGSAICEKQLFSMVDKLVYVKVDEEEIGKFLEPVYETLADVSKEELIKRFVSTEFNRFLSYYKNSSDINITAKSREKNKRDKVKANGKEVRRNLKDGKSTRFFINIGKMDDIRAGAIIRLLCDNTKIKASQIGRVELKREFSFFEVDSSVAEKVLTKMKKAQLEGRKIRVELSERKRSSSSRSTSKRRRR